MNKVIPILDLIFGICFTLYWIPLLQTSKPNLREMFWWVVAFVFVMGVNFGFLLVRSQ